MPRNQLIFKASRFSSYSYSASFMQFTVQSAKIVDKNKFSYETVGVRNNLSPQISLKMYVKCCKISTIWLIIFVKISSQGDFLSTPGSLQTMKTGFTK